MPSVNFTSCLFQHKKQPKIKVLVWTCPASRQGRPTDATLLLQQMKNIFEWDFYIPFLDSFIANLESRFTAHKSIIGGLQCLIPADPTVGPATNQIQSIKVLGEFYKEDNETSRRISAWIEIMVQKTVSSECKRETNSYTGLYQIMLLKTSD